MDILALIKLGVDLFKTWGVHGLLVGNLLVVLFLFWKLFKNHLAHLSVDVKNVHLEVNNVKDEVEKCKIEIAGDRKATAKLGERVSNIEGQLLERRVRIGAKTKKQPATKKK